MKGVLLTYLKYCLLPVLMLFTFIVSGAEPKTPKAPVFSVRADDLNLQMEKAWNTAWTKFYSSETHMFYDFICSYEPGKELDHLPTPEEVRQQSPNTCGYGTAMEDCMISAGVMLSAVLDRYAVTKEESLKQKALDIVLGIETCATVHKSPGFIARGVSPKAPGLTYINTSRDQVTHCVHSLWEFWHSPLADDASKKRVQKILEDVADRMIRNVIPENDYDFLCSDGSRCSRGICRMYKVDGHESARLPMFYAAAWDVSGKEVYYKQYRKYMEEAIRDSFNPPKWTATYALLQMQLSLDLLYRVEKDAAMKTRIGEAMTLVSKKIASRADAGLAAMKRYDMTTVAPDWRKAGGLNGEYRKIWYSIRESGEAALTQLYTPNIAFSLDQKEKLAEAILIPDFDHISTCGIYDIIGAWWHAKRLGQF